ncbi:MAG: chemotaxis protein CheW [Natronospirillum sp.]
MGSSEVDGGRLNSSVREDWLSLRIGDTWYCASLSAVREVLPNVSCAPVPGAAETVNGIAEVRGEVIAVHDGAALLEKAGGASASANKNAVTPDEASIVIVERADSTQAMTVDETGSIVQFNIDELEKTGDGSAVLGTIFLDPWLYVALDLERLLPSGEE